MAKAIGDFFNEATVGDGGSDYGYWRIVTAAEWAAKLSGTPAIADEWSAMPLREKYDIPNNSSTETKTSEGGIERTTKRKKKFGLTLDFQQFEDDQYDTIPDAVDGAIIEFVLERNQEPIADVRSYLHGFARCTKVPTPGAGRGASYEFDLLACPTAADYSLTVNSTVFPNFAGLGTTGGAIVHAPGKYYALHSLAEA